MRALVDGEPSVFQWLEGHLDVLASPGRLAFHRAGLVATGGQTLAGGLIEGREARAARPDGEGLNILENSALTFLQSQVLTLSALINRASKQVRRYGDERCETPEVAPQRHRGPVVSYRTHLGAGLARHAARQLGDLATGRSEARA